MDSEQIGRLLPELYSQARGPGTALAALLDAMVELLSPVEEAVGELPTTISPRRAPERFLPLLARWTGVDEMLASSKGRSGHLLEHLLRHQPGRLRELVARQSAWSRDRTTPHGIRWFLQLVTGLDGFDVHEEPGFRVVVHCPALDGIQRCLVQAVLRAECPAHVSWHLESTTGGSKQ